MSERRTDLMRGNPWFAPAYALSSLRNYPLRNMGIALILAIGIALPTTVFIWSSTGTVLVVEDYFQDAPIQLALTPKSGQTLQSSHLPLAQNFVQSNPFVGATFMVSSTVGILVGDGIPDWSSYDMNTQVYAAGIKDTRVLVVTNDLLSNLTNLFTCEGNFSLQSGQVLVSWQFVEYAHDVHGIDIEVGSVIGLDVLRYVSQDLTGTPETLGAVRLANLTVAGIYRYSSPSGLIPGLFPSISRKNWDPMGFSASVLGIHDSVMVLRDDLGDDVVEDIEGRGFFTPVVFVRPDASALLRAGAPYIASNLINLKTQVEERFPLVFVDGLRQLWRLEAFINTYLGSQVLTIIVLPIMVMSMMLTVFTSETSVSRRRGEISALRAKGASFNQVFATFMWESVLLAIVGLVVGVVMSIFLAPLVGASTGLLSFDREVYMEFFTHTTISPLALVIAAMLALYLPAAYLIHVARRIDVAEIGQPNVDEPEETAENIRASRYAAALGAVLSLLVAMPFLVVPRGTMAVVELLATTLILFVASYLGSRFMQVVTARLSGGINFVLGEKALYLSQSLRRRRRQFIPLLVILTLTLSTTTMMMIQTDSFRATVHHDIEYAIGADLRVECNQRPIWFNWTIRHYPGVLNVTPVIRDWAAVGSDSLSLVAVDPDTYLKVGAFSDYSFVSGTPSEVLGALETTRNGIVLSSYHAALWNKTVGDNVTVIFGGAAGVVGATFRVVGIMVSAPGFGYAAPDSSESTIASMFGFQVVGDGFALVNIDFLTRVSGIWTADLFLANTVPYVNITETITALDAMFEVTVYTPETFDPATRRYSLGLFMSGMDGLTTIGLIMCTVMGLASIALFLGSAVLERQAEYALFIALGGTKKQVVSMVFGEFAGSVVTALAISTVLGVIFGFTMSILSFGISPIMPLLSAVLSYPVTTLLAVLSLESIVILMSCYLPARRAAMTDPAVTLRNL